MSTSLLYHAFGLKGVKYISTEYKNGSTIFRAEVTSTIENCSACGSWETVHRKGFKERMFRLVPMACVRPICAWGYGDFSVSVAGLEVAQAALCQGEG